MRLLWHRLTESPEARLNRIRQFGFFRFCALYAVVFPGCHLLAACVRAFLIRTGTELGRLPVEIAGWSATGMVVAAAFWLAISFQRSPRVNSVPPRSATCDSHDG